MSSSAGNSLYGRVLARVHEAGFSGQAASDARFLLKLLPPGRVVDLGCGPGHWLAALTRAGREAVGVDVSPAMLALARRRAPKARLLRASLDAAKLPSCAAVTALGEPFNYLSGPAAVRRAFARVFAALEPGGVLVFDARLPGRAGPGAVARSGPDWFVCAEKQVDGRVVTRRITAFAKLDGRWERAVETHRVTLYPASELRAWLRAAGFRARRERGYFVAVKPRRASSPPRAR